MTGDDRNAHHVSGKILPDIRDGWSRSNVRAILTESIHILYKTAKFSSERKR